MSGDDEDEALTWAGGESDSSYAANPEPVQPLRAPKRAPRERRAAVVVDDDDDDELAGGMSSPVLLSVGILAGVYLLYTAGWVISFRRLVYASTNGLDQTAFHTQQILGIAAPAVWFAGIFWLTGNSKPWVRLVWLVIGAILLVPWSFVFGI
jgi:hypothetical protein